MTAKLYSQIYSLTYTHYQQKDSTNRALSPLVLKNTTVTINYNDNVINIEYDDSIFALKIINAYETADNLNFVCIHEVEKTEWNISIRASEKEYRMSISDGEFMRVYIKQK